MKIYLANPRGFCAGVDRAIDIVELSLKVYGAPIYVRNEIVHSRHVVNSVKSKGAVFVEALSEVPDGQTVIFSAHGAAAVVGTNAAIGAFKSHRSSMGNMTARSAQKAVDYLSEYFWRQGWISQDKVTFAERQ